MQVERACGGSVFTRTSGADFAIGNLLAIALKG
jgi:hypothetical protein